MESPGVKRTVSILLDDGATVNGVPGRTSVKTPLSMLGAATFKGPLPVLPTETVRSLVWPTDKLPKLRLAGLTEMAGVVTGPPRCRDREVHRHGGQQRRSAVVLSHDADSIDSRI